MKTLLLIASLSAGLYGQRTMTSTTLTKAVAVNDSILYVASTARMSPASPNQSATQLVIDSEAMTVTGVRSLAAGVSRGATGQRQSAHLSGATVWVGAPEDYAATDPEGACVSTSERVLPRVVLSTGKVWDCTAGLWVARTPSGLPITDDGSTLTVVGRGLDVGAYPIRASSISTGSGPLRISSHTGTCPTTAETDPVTMLQYDFTLCVEGTTLYTVSSLGVKTSMSGGGGSPYTPLVSGDWTTVNGSHCTPTFDTGALTIVSEVGSGDEICGKSIAIPTAPFARTFWVVPLLNGGNYPGASVGFSDGTQYFDCGVGAVSLALGLGAARWTNDHTYSGASYTPPTIIPANGTLMAFRLTVGQNLDGGTDAGKMHCGWSVSGTDGSWIELWNDVVGTTVSGSAMTPTKLYVATNPSSSGTVQRLQVVSYK